MALLVVRQPYFVRLPLDFARDSEPAELLATSSEQTMKCFIRHFMRVEVLAAIFFLVFSPLAHAELGMEPLEVIFDHGAPNQSVVIIGNKILEIDDMYDTYKIHVIEENAVVFESSISGEMIKLVSGHAVDQRAKKLAHHQFIIKQLEAVYEAQTAYYNQYKQAYAPDLETLIRHGYLANGFADWHKQGYSFEILETGQTPRHALAHENMPTFYAVAEPEDPESETLYFSIDYLGQVRFGDNREHARWAPVWDYRNDSNKRWQDISLDPPSS